MRGVQQEAAHTFGLALQHLFNQIVQHETMAAGERLDKTVRCLIARAWRGLPVAGRQSSLRCGLPERRCRPLKGADPSPGEKGGGFGGSKPQICGAQFGQLAAGAEPGQGERGSSRVAMTRCSCGGRCSTQKGEGLVNRLGIDQVVVVQDEDERVREGGDVIEQGRQDRVDGRWLRRLQHTQYTLSNRRRNGLQRSDEVQEKAGGVVLPFVQRQPGNWSLAIERPIR